MLRKLFVTAVLFFAFLAHIFAAYKIEDFKVDLQRADRTAGASRLYSVDTLKKIARFYANDPEGQAAFKKMTHRVVRILNSGDFVKTGTYKDYIFKVSMVLPGMVYFLTGHKALGEFIHDKTMDVVNRPLAFWLHAERFPMRDGFPVATLQTGDMLSRLVTGLDLAAELFSAEEKENINKNLRDKGLVPCELFLKGKHQNNWLAVIAGGAFVTAKYIGDSKSEKEISVVIKRYLDKSFECDGSYGEGQQYLLYPVGRLVQAAAAMNEAQLKDCFGDSYLSKAGEYLPYAFFFFKFNGKAVRIQFRDGQQISGIDSVALYSIALMCRSGLARGFAEKLKLPMPLFKSGFALLANSVASMPEAISPDTLPLMRVFDNGECYIRDSWDGKGIVFGMLSGGKNKTGFSHDRPARNGIALGAYGEYLLVTPGHSSYRGNTYVENDTSTHGNNAVTIDGKNQLFPRKKSKLDSYGIPNAKVIVAKSYKDYDVIISDAAGCYASKPTYAYRAAVFVKKPGYMVIFDHIGGAKGKHDYASYWHFNNLDNKSTLKATGTNNWIFKRPKAILGIYARSNSKLNAEIKPGIMHLNYSYIPGGKGEGRPGTARTLKLFSPSLSLDWKTATVLFPEKNGDKYLSVKVSGDGRKVQVSIGNQHDSIEFKGGKIYVNSGVNQ